MQTQDRFRFSLQWKADSDERIRAGELLERLGNKKSEFVVSAIIEYLKIHPELQGPTGVNIVVRRSHTATELEAIVRKVVNEKLKGLAVSSSSSSSAPEAVQPLSDDDIFEMVKNLAVFSP